MSAHEALNANITELIRLSKAPGLDGFTGLYYHKFSQLLALHLAAYYNSMREGGLPSSDSLKAHIT